jgi:hypothetical protein
MENRRDFYVIKIDPDVIIAIIVLTGYLISLPGLAYIIGIIYLTYKINQNI